MARRLAARQKTILKSLHKSGLLDSSNLSSLQYNQLDSINSYENLDSDIDRYLRDLNN